jgi:dephospho-CoA kinase
MLIIVGAVDSGKTTFAQVAKSFGYHVFEMGDVVRESYRKGHTTKPYTEFVSEKLDSEGKSFVAKIVVEKIKKQNLDLRKVVVVGPRTLEEVSYLKDNLGPARIVLVWADMRDRYRRWNADSSMISKPMTYEEFIERNQIEDRWGLAQVLAKQDTILVNEGSIGDFRVQAKAFLESIKNQENLLFNRFKPIKKLGEGQSKETWKASDRKMGDRIVALKILKAKDRFRDLLREAGIAGALDHPNIAFMHEVNENEGYLVEKYIDGKNLEEVIKDMALTGKQMPIPESARILTQLLDALCYAHKERRIHGDLKPANIMICRDEDVKAIVTDFEVGRIISESGGETGFSKETRNLGSIHYWAPELFEGKHRSKKTDLFALGIIAYLLFTLENPFVHPCGYVSETDLIRSKSYRPHPMSERYPALPRELDKVVLKLLEKDEHRRYDDAEKARHDFLAIDFKQ